MRELWELGIGLPPGSQRTLEYQKHGHSTMRVGGDLSVHEFPARASAELANNMLRRTMRVSYQPKSLCCASCLITWFGGWQADPDQAA